MKIGNTKKHLATTYNDNLKIKIEKHKLSKMFKKHFIYFQHQVEEL